MGGAGRGASEVRDVRHMVTPYRSSSRTGRVRRPMPGRDAGASHGSAGRAGGGAGRDRTGDLLNAIQALSQLSYGPTRASILPCSRPGVKGPGWDVGGIDRRQVDARPVSKSRMLVGMLAPPAGVAKLVYAGDSKSPGRKVVRVRIPPPARSFTSIWGSVAVGHPGPSGTRSRMGRQNLRGAGRIQGGVIPDPPMPRKQT